MKIKRTFTIPLLIKSFALAAIMNLIGCVEKPCPVPVCQPPNLNGQMIFKIRFCTEESDEFCYQPEELTDVLFITKDSYGDADVVDSQSIEDLEMTDYAIRLGLGGFKFGPEPSGFKVLQWVEYYYEISLDFNSIDYVLDGFKVVYDGNECECGLPRVESIVINGIETEVIGNTILLKK